MEVIHEVRSEATLIAFAILSRLGILGMTEVAARVSLQNETHCSPRQVDVVEIEFAFVAVIGPIAELPRSAFTIEAQVIAELLGII